MCFKDTYVTFLKKEEEYINIAKLSLNALKSTLAQRTRYKLGIFLEVTILIEGSGIRGAGCSP